MPEQCGARTVFWPDDECIDVGPCVLPEGHKGDHKEEDAQLMVQGSLHVYPGQTWDNDDDA